MLDEDLEQFLLGFDAIRSAQAVPPRWSAEWDERLKRGHEVWYSRPAHPLIHPPTQPPSIHPSNSMLSPIAVVLRFETRTR